jgi:hypothetical protein
MDAIFAATMLAADTLENFIVAKPTSAFWTAFAINNGITLVTLATVSLAGYLLLLFRPPSRARVVFGFMAATCFNVLMPTTMALMVLSKMPMALRVVLAIVPLIAFAFVLRGIVWIACHWCVFDPTRCGVCNHQLLREQIDCPECGAARRVSPVWGWGAEQSRVAARTALAVACVIISLYAVGALGLMKLEWHAKLFIELFDEHEAELATILADATVVERAVAREIAVDGGASYGAQGWIREVSGAVAAPPGGNNQTMVFASIQPRDGSPLDEAWLAALPSKLASFPPMSAEASANWMRTITARLEGKSANFASDIAAVRTTIDLRYPSLWAIIAVMCAGPIAVALVALGWKYFIAYIMRKAQAITKQATTRQTSREVAPTQTSE